ncbi:MAG: aspartate/glutamate racemase family protein, partial [Pigmentiphaga sp.]
PLDHIIRDGAAAGRFDATQAHIANTMVGELRRRGAHAIVLACTELPQILAGSPAGLPLIDSTRAHVQAILRAA